jgi:hypothetical protein
MSSCQLKIAALILVIPGDQIRIKIYKLFYYKQLRKSASPEIAGLPRRSPPHPNSEHFPGIIYRAAYDLYLPLIPA